MIRRPPRSPLFPSTPLSRSLASRKISHPVLTHRSFHATRPPSDHMGPPDGYDQCVGAPRRDRKSTRLNSSHLVISYAVFCLKKKTIKFRISSSTDRADGDPR